MAIVDQTDSVGRASLVLLPAMSCDEELYGAQIDAVADVVEPRVLVVEENTMAQAVATVLDQAPSTFVLAGTSYGSNLALEVALAAPARVAGLWLMGCNPGRHGNPAAAQAMCSRAEAGGFTSVVEELAGSIVDHTGPNGAQSAEVFRGMAHRTGPDTFRRQIACLIDRQDRREDLSRIACPTLLLWGRNDAFADVGLGEMMANAVSDSEFVVLENCGHLPTLEQPSETLAALRLWLTG